MRHLRLTIVLLITSFSASAQRANETMLFSVNKKPVMADEFIYLYRKNHQQKEDFTEAKIQEYLNLYINFKLKVEEARNRGLDTTKTFKNEFNGYRNELRKPYLPEGKILDSLVLLTYNRMKEEIRASHLLIGLKSDATPGDTLAAYTKAVQLMNRALQGEDFGTLAETYSEDPSAKTNKGDLGYFTALQMVYPFETAAYKTEPGSIAGPVRTRFGYHLIKVTDRKPARGEVEVSHIMLRTGGDKDETAVKNQIFDIYDQLRGGVSWDDLCKQYSEDPGSKNSGGRLRPFGVGAMAAVPEFDKVAFNLQNPGDISDPFQTAYGWHIVRLEKKTPFQNFDELSATLKSRVSRDERVQLSKKAMEEKLRRDLNVSVNEKLKTEIFKLADSTLMSGTWKIPASSLAKETLLTVSGKSMKVSDFFDYIQSQQRKNSMSPQRYIEQLYNSFEEQHINEAFEKKIMDKNPDFRMLLNEYYEGILLFDIMEKEVWNKASEDSIGQHRHYEEHKDSYQSPQKIEGVIYAGNKTAIEKLGDLLAKGDSAATEQFVRSEKIKKETGVFSREEREFLAAIPMRDGLHTVDHAGMSYLVKADRVLPATTRSFEEARSSVISDYQNALEQQWIQKLKKKYAVKVNGKGKKYILHELQDK